MLPSPAIEELAAEVEASGLINPRSSGVVLVSGGPDSACAVAALARCLGPESISALHVNYALRLDSGEDERAARALCAKLRVDLHVERPELGSGNVQAEARRARYDAAERLRRRLGRDWVATGHTRTDLAETFLYRLASSPGTRPLQGLPPRSGAVVRPLNAITRERTRELAAAAGLPFVDDPSNESPAYARNRIRAEILPVLRELSPEVERNIASTHAELHEEAELLAAVVLAELERAGAGTGAEIEAAALAPAGPGLRRLMLRTLAERALGRPVALNRSRAAQIARLAGGPEGGEVQLGDGLRAVCESGHVRFEAATPAVAAPEPVEMSIPGRARFGDWELIAQLQAGPVEPAGPELATLDAAALGSRIEVRAWRSGDRIRPLGLGGSKSLQDLFTDRGVPRSERARVPVVTAGGRVAWVAGVAVSEEFRLGERSRSVAILQLRRAG